MPSIESPTHYERSKGIAHRSTDEFFKFVESDDYCGNTESPLGYVMLVNVDGEMLDSFLETTTDGATPDQGWYVTRTDDNGIVWAMIYGTGVFAEEGARADYAEAEKVASAWDRADDQDFSEPEPDEKICLMCDHCGEGFDSLDTAYTHHDESPGERSFTLGLESEIF